MAITFPPLPPIAEKDQIKKDWFRSIWDWVSQNRISTSSVVNGTATPLVATTVGAAGGASALPATPKGYVIISLDGVQYKVPFYNL